MDREFFSVDVMNRLKKMRQNFLVPCRLNPGIKKALAEYDRHERKAVSTYTMGSEDMGATFTLVILPKADPKSSKVEDKYIAFATNMQDALWNISIIPEEYRKRWGIETGYKEVEQLRARTTSRNHSLRLLYFYYALILYNAWLLANLGLARKFVIPYRININMQVLNGIFHALFIGYLKDKDSAKG